MSKSVSQIVVAGSKTGASYLCIGIDQHPELRDAFEIAVVFDLYLAFLGGSAPITGGTIKIARVFVPCMLVLLFEIRFGKP